MITTSNNAFPVPGVIAVCSLWICTPSHADFVYSETSGIASPTDFINFDGSSLTSGDTVTNQFPGVTFSGTNGSPRFQSCGPGSAFPNWGNDNLDDNTYIGSFGPVCGQNGGVHDLTMEFDEPVHSVSFQFLAYLPGAAEMFSRLSLAGTGSNPT